MRITNEADYALRIVCLLADGNVTLGGNDIAQASVITPKFAQKILHKLVSGGLVKSFRGVGGGYALAQPAEKITIKNIIELIDGPLEIYRCVDSNHECTCMGNDKTECTIHGIFSSISASLSSVLDSITVRMVVDKSPEIGAVLRQMRQKI